MNAASSTGVWDIPPPPGTEDVHLSSGSSKLNFEPPPTLNFEPPPPTLNFEPPRAIDRLDPYLKNPQYLEYEKKSGRHKGRSRSRSYDRHDKRRRSRSTSKSRHRHRRSSSRSHRKRKYSKSRSRSRSKSHIKYNRRDRDKKPRHSSRSRNSSRSRHSSRSKYSRSRSRSESKYKSYKSHKQHRSSRTTKENRGYEEKPTSDEANHELVDTKVEEEEEPDPSLNDNAFKNDGSFLEMFKKMQEEKQAQEEEAQKAETEKQKLLPTFGKRRGGRVLKTGMVLKAKPQDNEESAHDPWSVYMKEVKRYKEACCDDDSKTRPLVK